jgi:amidophosphoribosyltransferase
VKLNVVEEVVEGKRVIIVDDSIIRGTTSKSRVGLLWEAGAEEVHLRISCPPTVSPCYYGIDFPNKEELIANNKTLDEIAEHADVTSLAYLSIDGLYKALDRDPESYCTACWTREYPVEIEGDLDKHVLERNHCRD